MIDVLVVDDDASIRKTVGAGLRARNLTVRLVATGQDAIEDTRAHEPAVVVLDLGLPDIDGVDVVRAIRAQSAVPIIVLSADGSDTRKVLALELGADDYVTKPFSMAELVARVRVAMRHREQSSMTSAAPRGLVVGKLEMNLTEHTCSVAGAQVDLTPKEFEMLAILATRPGSLVTHRVLLQRVWGHEYSSETHYLRVYASHIRKKLGEGPGIPSVRVESGVGYRLILDVDDQPPR